MEVLPYEIITHILSFLSISDLVQFASVNKYGNGIAYRELYKYPRISSKKQLESFINISKWAQSFVEVLDFSQVFQHIPSELFIDRLQYLHNLKYINLSQCKPLTTSSILALIERNASTLRTLNLANCAFTDQTLFWIGVAGRNNLTSLDLSGTAIRPWISFDDNNYLDSMLVDKTRHPKIRYLNLSNCSWVNHQTMKNVAQGMPYLEQLDVHWCQRVTLRSLLALIPKLNSLISIDVRHIYLDDPNIIKEMLNRASSLKKVVCTKRATTQIEMAL